MKLFVHSKDGVVLVAKHQAEIDKLKAELDDFKKAVGELIKEGVYTDEWDDFGQTWGLHGN